MAPILSAARRNRPEAGKDEPLAPLVLCADDDDAVRALCAAQLARAGFRTDTARNGREVLQRLEEQDYDAVLLDLNMPLVHGATVLAVIAQTRPALLDRVVIMTGLPDAAFDYLRGDFVLRKPIRNETLVDAVRACCGGVTAREESTQRTAQMRPKDSVRAFVASLIQSYSQ